MVLQGSIESIDQLITK